MKTLFLVCFIVLATPLFARDKTDVVVMKNGDRLTCEIKALDSGTLYISVGYILGTISLDWSEVDHFESKQLFILKTQDGGVHTGVISTPKTLGGIPEEIEVLETPQKTVTLERTKVIKIDETFTSVLQRFNGQIGMGLTYSKGNQSTQYNLNSDIYYPQPRWGAGASYDSTLTSNSGSSPSTRNDLGLTAQRLSRWNNWYYAGLADFLQSSEQGIQLSSTYGGGIGRYLKNTSHTTFTVMGGPAFNRINYDQMAVQAPPEDVVSGVIGTNLKLLYFDKTTLVVNAYLLPAFSDRGRVHFNLDASYYVKLWGNLKWNLTFYGNWDNRPPPGLSGSDYGSSSGITWTFGNR